MPEAASIMPLNRTIWSIHEGPIWLSDEKLFSSPAKQAHMAKPNSNLHFSSNIERSGMPANFAFGPAAAIGYAAGFERSRFEVPQSVGCEQSSCPKIGENSLPVVPSLNALPVR
jgi:hypothetical protein